MHTIHRALAGAATAALIVLAGAPTAQATTYYVYDHCSSGGFTGTVRVLYDVSGSSRTVREIAYKINKGPNSGGNSANIYWTDYGVLPKKQLSTGSGIQDGKYHVLSSADYSRGGGDTGMFFVFDKKLANDPSCGTGNVL